MKSLCEPPVSDQNNPNTDLGDNASAMESHHSYSRSLQISDLLMRTASDSSNKKRTAEAEWMQPPPTRRFSYGFHDPTPDAEWMQPPPSRRFSCGYHGPTREDDLLMRTSGDYNKKQSADAEWMRPSPTRRISYGYHDHMESTWHSSTIGTSSTAVNSDADISTSVHSDVTEVDISNEAIMDMWSAS